MPSRQPPTGESFREQVRRLSQAALDLLFPPRCVICRQPGAELCAGCRAQMPVLRGPVCPVCSLPLPNGTRCARCDAHRPAFRRVRSAYRYEGGVRRAIHALKYEGRRGLAAPLAEALAEQLPPPDRLPDAACAVPMHPVREAQRGYNHARLLALELMQLWGIPVLPAGALHRTQQTAAQVGLDYSARLANVQGAFAADPALVRGCTILVVDDVCTTGATLDACASELLQAGAAAVEGVTLARTL